LPRNNVPLIPRIRIETLSDLVFGLALSIGALTLVGKSPATPADLQSEILSFGFSFLILISVWVSYTRIMSVLPVETGFIVVLNLVLLFLVSIEPYLLSLLASTGPLLEYESVLYALDLFGLMSIEAFFAHILSIEDKKLVARTLVHKQKARRNEFIFSAFLFLISILPQFWLWSFEGTRLRILLWYSVLVILWSTQLYGSRKSVR
jgi:uncharacterized membrane protein